MFTRANAALGANWSLHDLRHSAAYRMARDPGMPLTDIQWVMGHAHLSTTQQYLTPLTERCDRERARLPCPAARTWSGGLAAGAGIPGREPEGPVRRGHAVTAAAGVPLRSAAAAGRGRRGGAGRPDRRDRCGAAGTVPAAAG